jgi:Flp pilus assembly protein TadD
MKPQYVLLVMGYSVAFYLLKTVYPANLVSDYLSPQPLGLTNPEVLIGVVATVGVIAAIGVSVRRTRAWLVGGLCFFVAVLPTLGVIRYTASITANRSMYLPMVGLLLPLAWGLGRLWNSNIGRLKAWSVRAMMAWAAAVLVILSIGTTRRYEGHWHDTLTLLRYYLTQSPRDARLHTRLGNEWVHRGEYRLASEAFREAIRLNPTWAENHLNLGRALFTVGDLAGARAAFASALHRTPKDWRAHMLMGMTLTRQRALGDALSSFQRAAQLAPTRAEPHYEMGNTLAKLGRMEEAKGEYATALRLNPGLRAAKSARQAAGVDP